MKIIYLREKDEFTKKSLENEFKGVKETELKLLIEKLIALKVLKKGIPRQSFEEIVQDEEVDSTKEDKYWFRYVGIITIENICLIIYPKYIVNIENDRQNNHVKFKQIINVIDKFIVLSSSEATLNEGSHSTMALMIDLLRDYFESGLYITNEQKEEVNGDGLINWDKTLESSDTYLFDNVPYYLELITEQTTINMEHTITELHKAILVEISNKYKDILHLLSLPDVHFAGQELEAIGDSEYLIHLVEKELNNQFITSKQLKLKKLLKYLNNESQYTNSESIQLYGSFSFNLVWEDVCKRVYRNDLDMSLQDLGLTLNGVIKNSISQDIVVDYTSYTDLKSIVEKPKWKRTSDASMLKVNQTLQLDVLKVNHKEKCFQIYDAKYYQIVVNENRDGSFSISGQPGVGDITKQYLYQLAYSNLAQLNGYQFNNAFIIPKDDFAGDYGVGVEVATVSMNMLGDLGLAEIKIIARDCATIYKQYLND